MAVPEQTIKLTSESPGIELTDANMTVFNDNTQSVTITVDKNVKMGDTFPSPSTIASGASASAKVSASWVPGQSSFDFNFASGDKMKIDLGTGIYSTGSTPATFADGKSAAVLAPGPPFTTDIDYRLWFFNGPGLLSSLANSFIQANLPALVAYINQNPVTIRVDDNLSLEITSIALDPKNLQCVYGSALPQPGNNNWYLNAVLSLSQGTINGNVTIQGRTGNVNLSLNNAMLWLQVQFDPTFATKPQVQQLQMSLGDYTVSGTIIDILKVLFPFIARLMAAGASPYRVAGAINNQLNAQIISSINSVLANIGKQLETQAIQNDDAMREFTAPAFTTGVLALPQPVKAKISPPPNSINPSAWMSDSRIQALTLGQLKLPGTHDSATYLLSSILSQISYPDIQFLWYLNAGTAPDNGNNPIVIPPTEANPIYVGQPLFDWITGTAVNSISRTQDLTILEQLQAGIRHFDFRVYFDTRDNNFYTQHALRGPAFRDVLTQIQGFMNTNTNTTELIFAVVSHTNFENQPDRLSALADLIKSIIPAQNIYYQPVPSGKTQFDFQTLAETTVGSITNGTSKIMFINGDSPDIAYADTITNTNGYAGVPWDGELYTVEAITEQQGPPTKNPHDPLWSVGWVLGADTPTIVQNILTNLTNTPKFALQSIASGANAQLLNFLKQYGPNFNVVTVDWLEYGASPSVPEMIINMNAT